ncbi:uncharacterized protein LOC121863237 isoform X5 [Homarus americanus]|nr:uncharacterized protein LOC121863237 isoform X5 [Homarus americanus]
MQSIARANKRPVNSEELIKYAHRISSTYSVTAPDTWQQGDPRRPYPIDLEMRAGFLGQNGQLLHTHSHLTDSLTRGHHAGLLISLAATAIPRHTLQFSARSWSSEGSTSRFSKSFKTVLFHLVHRASFIRPWWYLQLANIRRTPSSCREPHSSSREKGAGRCRSNEHGLLFLLVFRFSVTPHMRMYNCLISEFKIVSSVFRN